MNIEIYKGIHPGKLIFHTLRKFNISQRAFARQINVHNQTLNAIIKGKRNLPIEMAIKIEKALHFPEDSLSILQTYFLIKEFKDKNYLNKNSQVPNIRKILFWDTDFYQIDWHRQKKFVIERVNERGSDQEKKEILRFYNSNNYE